MKSKVLIKEWICKIIYKQMFKRKKITRKRNEGQFNEISNIILRIINYGRNGRKRQTIDLKTK